jgi:hypothetical protein
MKPVDCCTSREVTRPTRDLLNEVSRSRSRPDDSDSAAEVL